MLSIGFNQGWKIIVIFIILFNFCQELAKQTKKKKIIGNIGSLILSVIQSFIGYPAVFYFRDEFPPEGLILVSSCE